MVVVLPFEIVHIDEADVGFIGLDGLNHIVVLGATMGNPVMRIETARHALDEGFVDRNKQGAKTVAVGHGVNPCGGMA
jgi:hypothetical protein